MHIHTQLIYLQVVLNKLKLIIKAVRGVNNNIQRIRKILHITTIFPVLL